MTARVPASDPLLASKFDSITTMRTTVPHAFRMSFDSVDGPYEIIFQPIDDWDGIIDISISGMSMRWDVVSAVKDEDGSVFLGGMTSGTEELWGDVYWFSLDFENIPPVIDYWGNCVLWRQDKGAASNSR
ncbi:hypothetical protein [Methylobacterium sp. AMS5]|uniref:hypothetical protein n=1 Tax=Methylobacterium sp. AMS5 TaxID=925818 RepID=UPI0011874CEE|nr:hypothetical protein [Methylobacterium sp. AMS5]